ncbi:uncharacterized protein LOC141618029 [Silene latifolia]|uniref:uncharacterized protein LOC141618029 n=1 Tax=Silene latifolia TaxID=37657 RepID=UPI003D785DA8
MALSTSCAYSTINELNESKKSGKIKACVSRIWEVPNPYAPGQLICIDMVLIDEEGGYVHASIYGNTLIDRIRSRLTEGDVYVMNHFGIEANKSAYRVVSESKVMLKFQFNTYIKKITSESSTIPRHSGNIIKLKLWRQFSVDFNEQIKEYRATMKLDTSSSSKVYINLDFPEVNELKSLLRENREEIFVRSVSSQGSNILKKDISTIINHCKLPYEKNEICYCQATVKEVMGELPWYNPSCPDCNRKPKTVSKGFFCEYCNKPVENLLTVYRLELLVEDVSGTTILTMFNDEAKKMIGQEATTLFDSHPEQDPSSEDYDYIPSLLRNTFEDKTFVFKVKIDKFNHQNRKNKKQTFAVMKVLDNNSNEELNMDKTAKIPTHKRQLEYISSDDEGLSTSKSMSNCKNRKVQD